MSVPALAHPGSEEADSCARPWSPTAIRERRGRGMAARDTTGVSAETQRRFPRAAARRTVSLGERHGFGGAAPGRNMSLPLKAARSSGRPFVRMSFPIRIDESVDFGYRASHGRDRMHHRQRVIIYAYMAIASILILEC